METINTYWFIGILLAFPAITYLIMVFNRKYMKRREQEINEFYIEEEIQLESGSGEMVFMM